MSLLRTLLLNYHYLQTTLWTYSTSVWLRRIFSTTANTTNSYTVQLWASPFSVVVAEIVMKNIEEQALATYTRTVPLWLRSLTTHSPPYTKTGIDDFHEHLNRQNADIQFTKEIEENGKIPFLECLVTRDNKKLKTTIYRKPTQTDRLLDQS